MGKSTISIYFYGHFPWYSHISLPLAMGENGANASFVPKQPRQRRKMLPCQSLATGVAWGEQQIGKKNEKGTRRWWLNHQRFFFLGVFFFNDTKRSPRHGWGKPLLNWSPTRNPQKFELESDLNHLQLFNDNCVFFGGMSRLTGVCIQAQILELTMKTRNYTQVGDLKQGESDVNLI